jgi:3',5'-cyclic-AMP phosphodiesterase
LAVDQINAAVHQPDLILHTGDLTHLARSAEFDTLDQILRGLRQKEVFYVPGEHDITGDDGKLFLERFGKSTAGKTWRSFNHMGVHFIGLNNCVQLEGLGMIGAAQLEWLAGNVAHLSTSTPIVVFAHIPLWSVYREWGWGTKDSARALAILKRFGSVTVLNGHIHQVMPKVEGYVTFHSAISTAFPQPAPGSASAMKVREGPQVSAAGLMTVPRRQASTRTQHRQRELHRRRSSSRARRHPPRLKGQARSSRTKIIPPSPRQPPPCFRRRSPSSATKRPTPLLDGQPSKSVALAVMRRT